MLSGLFHISQSNPLIFGQLLFKIYVITQGTQCCIYLKFILRIQCAEKFQHRRAER